MKKFIQSILNWLRSKFKKKKAFKIPVYVGLILMTPEEQGGGIKKLLKVKYKANDWYQLTRHEIEEINRYTKGVNEILQNPKKKKFNPYALTLGSLYLYENFSDTIQQAPYLLASMRYSDYWLIENEAQRIYEHEDFSEFWPEYLFFLTSAKIRLTK